MLSSIHVLFVFILLVSISNVSSFHKYSSVYARSIAVTSLKSTAPTPSPIPSNDNVSKGFGKAKEVVNADSEAEKDLGTKTYENQAKRGVPEYNIFLRPLNGTETDWVPVGSMTIPRDTAVAKAVYEVEGELLKGTFKLYPKLKAFADVRGESIGMFEYGYCLKAFPDEQITVIKKITAEEQNNNFWSNWLGKITNPIDTSELKNKGEMTLKQ